METFLYMGFFLFSKFLLVSNLVFLCALNVRVLECEKNRKIDVFIQKLNCSFSSYLPTK